MPLGASVQSAPAGAMKVAPATATSAVSDTSTPGVVKRAGVAGLAPQAVQACMGGSSCQAKSPLAAAPNAAATTARKNFVPVVPIGIGAAEVIAAVAGGATLGAAASMAYDHMKDQFGSLLGGHQAAQISGSGGGPAPNITAPGASGKAKTIEGAPTTGSALFPNRGTPSELDDELATAGRLGVTPAKAGNPDLHDKIDEAIDESTGKIKWPVLAAGEADIAGSKESGYYGLEIDNHSGHFQPTADSVRLGVEAFKRAGVSFPEESVAPR